MSPPPYSLLTGKRHCTRQHGSLTEGDSLLPHEDGIRPSQRRERAVEAVEEEEARRDITDDSDEADEEDEHLNISSSRRVNMIIFPHTCILDVVSRNQD